MPQNHLSATNFKGRGSRDAFLNLLALASLAWLAWAVGTICFQLANKFLNGMLASTFDERSIKYGLASLIIVAPLYVAVLNFLHYQYKKNNLNHESGIYRWLTYLMLFISALSIVGALVALIASWLNGDYTSNIICKILAVIIIAGFVFGYYFYDLRRRDYSRIDWMGAGVGIVALILIIVVAIAGFFSIESPAKAQQKLADQQLEQTLYALEWAVVGHYQMSGQLEPTIMLKDYLPSGTDTGLGSISYRKIDVNNFELCATFATDSRQANQYVGQADWFYHPAGRQCYQKNILTEVKSFLPSTPAGSSGAVQPAGAAPVAVPKAATTTKK